jgi:hypothetical protein
MKSPRMFLLCLCSFLLLSGMAMAAVNQTTTYLGYNRATGLNDKQYSILYQFPDPLTWGAGPYPLFMWTAGTFEPYTGNLALLTVNEMAARGFVAASIQYDNSNFALNCDELIKQASSIYDATRLTSAVGVMCAISGINCSAGIVTMGISQGGSMAVLAKNYAANVTATLALSVSDTRRLGESTVSFSSCLGKPFTAIPANRLTIINGASDSIAGGKSPLMRVSGTLCGEGAFQCWNPSMSGAGWYIVKDSQVVDGNADHCYVLKGGCFGRSFDDNWLLGTDDWEMKPNLDWLATFGTVRHFSLPNQ